LTEIERLNKLSGRVNLDELTRVEVRHWAQAAQLPDNVPHRHAYHEVCLVGERGAGEFLVEGVVHALEPGTVFFARPGVLHQIRNTQEPGMALSWVVFTLPPSPLALAYDASGVLMSQETGALGALWDALLAVAETGDSRSAKELMVPLFRTLLKLGAGESSLSPETTGLGARAVRSVHARLAEPPSVSTLASELALSERHFSRLFVAHTGVAPAAYIERARIERAASLLLRTDDPIKHVAAQLGYLSVHSFTRAFTRALGCPPGAFRKSQGQSARVPPAAPETEGQLVW
jgi:AraC-like DNA-binding protein/mannose-6-phosphate isomerase-like protein (cupin superfamily)